MAYTHACNVCLCATPVVAGPMAFALALDASEKYGEHGLVSTLPAPNRCWRTLLQSVAVSLCPCRLSCPRCSAFCELFRPSRFCPLWGVYAVSRR